MAKARGILGAAFRGAQVCLVSLHFKSSLREHLRECLPIRYPCEHFLRVEGEEDATEFISSIKFYIPLAYFL